MHPSGTRFAQLLEGLNRQQIAKCVARHGADAYDKCFSSWDHPLALIFAQLSPAVSLRGLEVAWNAHAVAHPHLGTGPLHRSTLSDANQRCPLAVFAETFARLAGQLDRSLRRDGRTLLRLIDASPIPLGARHDWACSNGRIRGLNLHLAYSPETSQPRLLGLTPATRNDAEIGRQIPLESAASYVFDKGYCHYGWWSAIAEAGAVFVTRPKTNMRLTVCARRRLPPKPQREGDGLTLLADQEVVLASKGDSRLSMGLRRIALRCHEGGARLTLLTNDLTRSATEIATLYKARWRIEIVLPQLTKASALAIRADGNHVADLDLG
ncbi:IS4 family transposase, partial [Methylobacterium sp. EM32]|uniref:IS4 family transposase n=1 Tax=Methylobacterium sp. EM32 TaxID=3163481 RepID=UPI0033B76D3A